ncbi:MAG: hypothetical protein PWP44_801 [Thermacetogenium sp.]|jgi:outer membrane murein-binding lipoprotein Lpp|uniref:DUF2802 domain-containing protein n=1 Tax=Thermacetogenium phaeum TaxID=85874 RepID=A0A101FGJ4_9THEO|nr:MAG: Uncharacterized protein XD66_0668 [Thermacetogenium phaeum]MDN5365598.1 hypothetical protein [Thermacetogenium sp.]MDN5375196.1 hypothetical protein [Thermacetogenium sp.]
MEPILVVLSLLTLCVICLVFLIVWRDRRDLKHRQLTRDISRLEEIVAEAAQHKKDMAEMLSAAKRQTEQAVSRMDNQLKQVRESVASLEQHLRNNRNNKERGKEKASKTQGRGKSRSGNPKQKERAAAKADKVPKIDDGEKYAKLVELAEQGLSTQEIAKQLNLGYDEVELVLELKRKNIG